MPSLTTIIPHLGNSQALETTLLSVLENQPDDCEVVLVHDGSYADPYQLSDELLIIEESFANPVALLNVGLMAACAPVVCVMSPGSTVTDDRWVRAAQLIDPVEGIGAVAVTTRLKRQSINGISARVSTNGSYLQRCRVDQTCREIPAGPNLLAGFYDRRTLLALDGWNEDVSWENADIELALLMAQLGIRCELANVEVHCDHSPVRSNHNANIKQLAEISVAYGASGTGKGTAMTDMLRGCLGGNFSAAVAWATGIMSASRGTSPIQSRIDSAKHNYRQLVDQRRASSASKEFHRAAA